MNHFCENCGASLEETHIICTTCGTRITEYQTPKQIKVVSTKRKWINRIVVLIAAVAISFSIWATNHFSAESLTVRFNKAVAEEDGQLLQKMMQHEDGTVVSMIEAEAFIALFKEETAEYLKPLYTIELGSKFLGIYPEYCVKVIDQYASYPRTLEQVTFMVGGAEAIMDSSNDSETVFGPYAPGNYKGVATFSSDFGDEKVDIDFILASDSGIPQLISVDAPIGTVVIELSNQVYTNWKPWIQIGDKKIEFPANKTVLEVGPLNRDGKHSVQIGVAMPWGEILTDAVVIEGNSLSLTPVIVGDKQVKAILDTLKRYGEELNEMRATTNGDVLTTVSPVWKENLSNEIDEDYASGLFYAGKLDKLEIDVNSIKPVDNGIQVWANYDFTMDRFSLEQGEPNLKSTNETWIMQMNGLSSHKVT